MNRMLSALAGVALGFSAVASASAQIGPGKTLTLMVPYPAGGLSDAIARQLAPALAKELGQTVNVENLGGASGGIAAQKLLNTPADGRMIFQGSPNELILSPLVNADIKFKPDQFRHVTQITANPLMVILRPDHPAKTVDEFVDYLKKAEKPVPYGSVGVGSLYHVLTEDMAKQVGAKVVHVPYKGAAPMLQDIASGAVDFTIFPFAKSYKGLEDAKKLRQLAWISKTRNDFDKGIQSFGESKSLPNFAHDIWAGIFVRKDTPADVVSKFNTAMANIMKLPELRTAIGNTGSIVIDTTSVDVADKYFASEITKLDAMTKSMEFKAQ